MRKILKFSMIMLAAGLVLGLAGCKTDDDGGKDSYSKYFQGSYRNNKNGKTAVENLSSSDMLLFEGATLSASNIVGGVRSGTKANINFSDKSNYQTGGWVLLRAVRLEEFKANGALSRVDHCAMAVFGEGREYNTIIEASTDGDFEYEVNNYEPNFALELRENEPMGRTIAFLTRGERNRVIKASFGTTLTVFPVWTAIDKRTMTAVTLAEAGPFQARTIVPIAPPGQRPILDFPIDKGPVFNPEVKSAGIDVVNNTEWGIRVGIAGQAFKAASTRDLINPGGRDSFEIEAAAIGLNMTITVPDGNVSVPVHFEGESVFPVLQNGYIYTVGFAQLTTTPSTDPSDWSAVIVESGLVDINAHLEAP